MINENISSSIIFKLVLQQFGRVDEVGICHYHKNLSYLILTETSDVHYDTFVEHLIAEFNQKTNIGIFYVSNDINSGFVTWRKE